LNGLAEGNASIEAGNHKLCAAFLRGGDLKDDIRETS
jgi:hypothetical protein